MADTNRYWDTWAPYWSYFEDSMLDIEGIQKLSIDVIDPVLVIGAGQGLLVEQLRQKRFKTDGVDLSPRMIKYAKQRRNIDLILADARKLPFADSSYKTVIVATGVVDFMDDEQQIATIVGEARRVTDAAGKTLLAFYRFHPKAEKLMKYMGVITDKDSWRAKRTYEFMSMNPRESIAALRKESNVSMIGAIGAFISGHVFLPKKEKRSAKAWDALWKKVRKEGGANAVIEAAPEFLPYRLEPQIRSLLDRLNQPIQRVYPYDSCTVVLLSPKAWKCRRATSRGKCRFLKGEQYD
jgi:ubiquinone/menaquinone biosynthesis C-methylase UbiE